MERERPRWRIRLSTLMLLVIIAALVSALVADRWKRSESAHRAEMEARRAVVEARQAIAAAQQERARAARAATQAPGAPDGAKGSGGRGE
jgi:hypothetical protein